MVCTGCLLAAMMTSPPTSAAAPSISYLPVAAAQIRLVRCRLSGTISMMSALAGRRVSPRSVPDRA
ncbi:MAG: hypothetical protein R3E31_11790 [Chloroflexota bacterium]